jgi:hypothetical protein
MNNSVRKRKPKSSMTHSSKEKQPSTFNWWSRALGIRSIIVAIVVGLLLYEGISKNTGYQWTWESLLKGNWNYIQRHRKASLDERNQGKLGFDYMYLSFIKKNTPEDAIILFPLRTHITEQNDNKKLSGNIATKSWVTHFVYPRTVLYKDEKDTNPLYNKVTHVAIIAGHGYEDVEYEVQKKYAFTVIPKKR